MKTIMFAAATAAAMIAVPASAGTLNAEVRVGDVRNGTSVDNTEYRVQWDAPIASGFTYGAEIQVKQAENEGRLNSKVSGKLGYQLPEVLGFHTIAYGEVGENLQEGDNFGFWGAGVKTRHQVAGPVSISVGYRHREAFTAVERLQEDRLNAGLGFDLSKSDVLGVTYYRTTGTTRNDQIGVGITHRF